jgi:hypothetical protein
LEFAGIIDTVVPDVNAAVGTKVAGLIVGFDRDFGTYKLEPGGYSASCRLNLAQ